LIYLNKCDRTNEKCKGEEYMSKKLSNVILSIVYVLSEINNKKFSMPNVLIVESSALMFSYSVIKRFYYYITQVVYDTDEGYFFENHRIDNFHYFDLFRMDVELIAPGIYNHKPQLGSVAILNSNYVANYFRSYNKISTMFANLGGIIKFIVTISNAIGYLLTENSIFENLSKSFFNFESNTEEIRRIKVTEKINH
jgi:hypothetical protein